MIYLHGPLDVLVERIAPRGRPNEKDASSDYWSGLHARYERWIARFRHCPVLPLDVREYDLFADPNAVEEIAAGARPARGRAAADGAVAAGEQAASVGVVPARRAEAARIFPAMTDVHGFEADSAEPARHRDGGKYVYCIIRSERQRDFGAIGIGGGQKVRPSRSRTSRPS